MAVKVIDRLPMRELVAHASGGGWGAEAATDGTSPVAIIRGADFPQVATGDARTLPVRWETDRKIPQRTLEAGDIVLEISGGTDDRPTGRTVFVTDRLLAQHSVPVIPASFCRLVRIDQNKADPRYAYYWLQSMYSAGRTWEYQNRSTGLSNFQFNYFLDAETVDLPPLDEQRRIAHILGTLDDKIELNRRMNETLEEMERALFKSWFVDFDPVRAKAEGRDPGLPKHLADLFPDHLVDSELGEIPEGWKVQSIDDVAVVSSGRRPITTDLDSACIPVLGGNGQTGWAQEPLTTGPLLVTGRVGTLGVVSRVYGAVWPSDNTLVLHPREAHLFQFTYYALSSMDLLQLNRGSTQPLLSQRDLKAQPLIGPSRELLQVFDAFTAAFALRGHATDMESRNTTMVRDLLLAKLLAGGPPLTEVSPE